MAPTVAEPSEFRCGTIAIVGRPNVGKSSLLNRLVGQKVSITSRRPQTTRHRIAGVRTTERAQLVLLDSPGMQTVRGGAMNRYLNRTARQVAADADVVVFVIDGNRWTKSDDEALAAVPKMGKVLLVPNKIDSLKDRATLVRAVDEARKRRDFADVIPVSARSGKQIDVLLEWFEKNLPVSVALYEKDDLTDRSERFLAAELIREKLFRLLGDELPYESTVIIDSFETTKSLTRIHATILVARDAQKAIIIGAGGERLKRMATQARLDLEKMLDNKVFLEVFVKVRSGWADSDQSLRAYGYE